MGLSSLPVMSVTGRWRFETGLTRWYPNRLGRLLCKRRPVGYFCWNLSYIGSVLGLLPLSILPASRFSYQGLRYVVTVAHEFFSVATTFQMVVVFQTKILAKSVAFFFLVGIALISFKLRNFITTMNLFPVFVFSIEPRISFAAISNGPLGGNSCKRR